MANVRREIVGYKKLDLQPIQPEGLLAVARAGGELEEKVANFMFRIADEAGARADREAELAGERAGRQAALAGRPGRMSVTGGAETPEMAGGTPAVRRTVNLSGDRQKFIDTLMPAAIEASRRTGVDPRIIVAQAAQETGWGRAAPGNNYFGIKSHGQGGGQTFTTHEVVNGRRVKIQDSFRTFASPEDSVSGYADFILQNPRYSSFRGAQGLDAQLAALQASGYATDPNYSNAVGAIARSINFTGGSAGPIDRSRPILDNGDGTFSTEETITVDIDRDGQKRWVNLPTIVNGERVGEEEAVRLFNAGSNPAVGDFATLQEAEAAARARSDEIGRQRRPTPQQVAAPAIVSRLPTGNETFRPSNRDSVYGRAYDAAGTRTFLQLLDSELRSTTAQAFRQYQDNPEQLAVTLDTLKRVQLRDDVPEEIRAEYEVAFEAQAQRYLFQAQANADRKLKEENTRAFELRSMDLGTDIERMLESFDPELPGVETAIAEAQTAIDDHYDTAVANGVMTHRQAEIAKRKSRSETAVQFYLRQAGALEPDDIAAMGERMEADFKAGALPGIDGTGWAKLKSGLDTARATRTKEIASQRAAVETQGQALADRALAGFDIAQDELNRFVIDAGKTGNDELVAAALAKIEAAEAMRDMPLADAMRHVEQMRKALPKDASNEAIGAVNYAEERLAQLVKLAETDPAAYEIQRGRLQLEPIALDSAEAMDASLATRRDQMREVAQRFGREVPIFRPGEVAALNRAILESPEAFPDFAASVASVFGADAGKVLSEIAPDMPTLAHAAGVMGSTGDRSLAVDLAQAISAKQKGEWKAKMPTEQKFMAAALPMLGSSLSFMDATRASVLGTAQLLLERDANLAGFDPAEVNKADTPAHASLRNAINRALGAQMIGGQMTGGIGAINGSPVVLPTGMSEAETAAIVQSLTSADLAALTPIASANGVPVTADQLRWASLVTVGDGVYRVALGDPNGWDPQFVLGEEGDFWTLDVKKLDADRRSRAYFRNEFGFMQPRVAE